MVFASSGPQASTTACAPRDICDTEITKHTTTMIDYFTTNLWAIWIAIAFFCLLIELSSGDFFVTCFAIGAACSMVFSFFSVPLWIQILVFAVCSVLSIIFIRPSLVRRVHNRAERLSNADALIGREGKVIADIEADGFGYVKIDGDEWRAKSEDGTPIHIGDMVRIVSRDSIIVSVQRI